MNRHARAVSDRQQQPRRRHRVVLVAGLGSLGFEFAVLQGAADVGPDCDALRFGKSELLNAKVRMGRSPAYPYTKP